MQTTRTPTILQLSWWTEIFFKISRLSGELFFFFYLHGSDERYDRVFRGIVDRRYGVIEEASDGADVDDDAAFATFLHTHVVDGYQGTFDHRLLCELWWWLADFCLSKQWNIKVETLT